MTAAVQKFVRYRHAERVRTVSRDVLDFLESKTFIKVDRKSRAGMNASLREVQRFLANKGYKRGKRRGKQH